MINLELRHYFAFIHPPPSLPTLDTGAQQILMTIMIAGPKVGSHMMATKTIPASK